MKLTEAQQAALVDVLELAKRALDDAWLEPHARAEWDAALAEVKAMLVEPAQDTTHGPRDWPDKGENGQYQCRCCVCGELFAGHKRRSVCRVCVEHPLKRFAGHSPRVEEGGAK